MNNHVMVTRQPGLETVTGDLVFKVTVPRSALAVFLNAYPDFEMLLPIPALAPGASVEAAPLPQGIYARGWETFEPGFANPNPPVAEPTPQVPVALLNLCRLPTFQAYAARECQVDESEIEDSDEFAKAYMETLACKPLEELTERDVETLVAPFIHLLKPSHG